MSCMNSNHFSPPGRNVLKIFIELRSQQEGLAFDYEEQSSYEMEYLFRWYVLENFLKILHTQLKTDEIHNKVHKWWEEYLLNSESNQPEPLKSLSLKEPPSIPKVGDIEMHLGCELPIVKNNASKIWG